MLRDFLSMWLLAIPAITGTHAYQIAAVPVSTPVLALADAEVAPPGTASIDVVVASGDRQIAALQFDLRYEIPALGISETIGSAAINSGKKLFTSNPQTAVRRILIAGLNATPIGDGVVATLSVAVSAGASPRIYPLVVTNVVASDALGNAVSLPARDGSLTVPGPVVQAVTNGASYAVGAVAPGEILVVWGRGFSETVNKAALPAVRVLFDGNQAPLLYSTFDQLGAIVPYAVDGHAQTLLEVEYRGIRSAPSVLAVARSSPGIFTLNGTGAGQGAILNQDGTVNEPENPAPAGSIVSLYATGEGQTVPPGVDGKIVDASDLRRPLLPVTASIGDQTAEVIYAGSAAGQVSGLLQVNLRVPLSAPSGASVPVKITIGGASQSRVTIAVSQNKSLN